MNEELIGYTESFAGFLPLYAPATGSVVTHAFILCKYCDCAISPCMGPRLDAVCIDCYEHNTDVR